MSDTETKVCKRCKVEKPLSGFHSDVRDGVRKYRNICRTCRNKDREARAKPGYVPKVRKTFIDVVARLKECRTCGEILSFDKFSSNQRGVGGLCTNCKSCTARKMRIARSEDGTDPGARPEYYFDAEMRERECTLCRRILSFEEFASDSNFSSGIGCRCRQCRNSRYSSEMLEKHPLKWETSSRYYDPDAQEIECCLCGKVLPLDHFPKNATAKYGVGSYCTECFNSKGRAKRNGGVDPGSPIGFIDPVNQVRECTKCHVIKPFSEFHSGGYGEDNISSRCKVCVCEDARLKRNGGVDPGPGKYSDWDYEKGLKTCILCDEWKPFDEFVKVGKSLSARCKACKRKDYAKNAQLRLRNSIRATLFQSLKEKVFDERLRDRFRGIYDVGCSAEVLVFFIETQFYPNPRTGEEMSWSNYGRRDETSEGWEVDHIKPLSMFDLADSDQFMQASHVSNLQPLWKLDNVAKGDNLMDQDLARKAYQIGLGDIG
jgi:hypothetical protein